MNLPVIVKGIVSGARRLAGSGLLTAKAHAPEILVGSGIVGFGVTIYGACKATLKTQDILEQRDECIKYLNTQYSGQDKDEKIKDANRIARQGIVKAYLPAATAGVAATAAILGGYKMINGRLVATAAAYKALETGFDRYRDNVRREYGDDVDWKMLNSFSKEDEDAAEQERAINKAIEADNKRRGLHHKKKHTAYQAIYSQIFDHYSDRWQYKWTPDQVMQYLRKKEREANDMLRIRKHLFVNEVYDLLGLPRTREGQVVGWIITKDNPNAFVSFGLDGIPEEKLNEIMAAECNEDIKIRLNFNPHGVIYDLIDHEPKATYVVE